MPSPEEWEKIRGVFQRLYVIENKTLREIRHTLGVQGFHATPKQWKNQITSWGLRKNNERTDMLFAMQKLSSRRATGKDTTFRIRGATKTSQEVLRYWKRAKTQAAAAKDHPQTPSGIEYSTPPPEETWDASAESVVFNDLAPNLKYGVNCQPVIGNLSGLHHLQSPDWLRNLEIALFQGREFQSLCIRHSQSTDNIRQRSNISQKVSQFWQRAETIRACAFYGRAPYCLQQAYQTCINLIIELITTRELRFLTLLLAVTINYSVAGQINCMLSMLSAAVNHLVSCQDLYNPFLGLAKAIIGSVDHIQFCSEALSRSSIDYLVEKFGHTHPLAVDARQRLVHISLTAGRYHEYDWLVGQEHLYFAQQEFSSLSHVQLCRWLEFQLRGSRAQYHLGQLSAAANLAEKVISNSNVWPLSPRDRAAFQCLAFTNLGMIRFKTDVADAVDAYTKAISAVSGIMPADSGMLVDAVCRLEQALKLQLTVSLTVL